MSSVVTSSSLFFFNDTASPEIYTLSLHDALPIYLLHGLSDQVADRPVVVGGDRGDLGDLLLVLGGLGHVLELFDHRVHRLLDRSEEHTSELQSQSNLVCRLLLEKKDRSSTHRCTY